MFPYDFQLLYDIFEVPMVSWGKEVSQIPRQGRFPSPVLADEGLRKRLEQACGKGADSLPVILREPGGILYGTFALEEGQYFALGGILSSPLSSTLDSLLGSVQTPAPGSAPVSALDSALTICSAQVPVLGSAQTPAPGSIPDSIPVPEFARVSARASALDSLSDSVFDPDAGPSSAALKMERFKKLLVLCCFRLTGRKLSCSRVEVRSADAVPAETSSEREVEAYLDKQWENERHHGRGIELENKFMEMIRQGDVEGIKKISQTDLLDIREISEVSEDFVRQIEYNLVAMDALATRAAVEGGMNPEEAYVLGDVYLRQVEVNRRKLDALHLLGFRMMLDFADKVRKARQRKSQSPYLEKCKDYIFKNLRKQIRVSDIAPVLGISQSHLTHLFSELEGMTIQQYIMKLRCEHAANLLKYSDYSIAQISEYFCFASQSHFGSCFKRLYGMSPKEYRMKHGRKDVIEKM